MGRTATALTFASEPAIHGRMSKPAFYLLITAVAGAVGALVHTGLIPEPYNGLAIGFATFLTGLVRPKPEPANN